MATSTSDTVVLVVAAGRGERAGRDVPKQYALLDGEPVLRRTLRAFLKVFAPAQLHVVIDPGHRSFYDSAVEGLPALGAAVAGGATRQESVCLGLRALASAPPRSVLIHDAARPYVSTGLIHRVLDGLGRCDGVTPVLTLTDTIVRLDDGRLEGTLDRSQVARVQTPQGFAYSALADAHDAAARQDRGFTDDASLFTWSGHSVHSVAGDEENRKLTHPSDFGAAAHVETRTGTGFDVHAFAPGDHVVLCGVEVPHDQALKGHSDADVGLHALTDAIFGALCEGDIGAHFPPSDPRWGGASSDLFLARACERIAARGGRLVHCDVTLLCETPKVGPHRDAMRRRVAEICGVGIDRISVKATTTERLGFTGRGEGIAAMASASIALPAVARPEA